MITVSVKTRLHNGQRRSFGGRSSWLDLDEVGIDDETFFSLDCRTDWANASCFHFLSTYDSLEKKQGFKIKFIDQLTLFVLVQLMHQLEYVNLPRTCFGTSTRRSGGILVVFFGIDSSRGSLIPW